MTDTTFMRTWAEIDLDALDHNYKTLRGETEAGCRFLGLCKANAYGHGAAHIGPELQRLGAEMLAVACIDEAAELRRAGVTIPILCLGQVPAQLAPMLAEYRVTQRKDPVRRRCGCGLYHHSTCKAGHRDEPPWVPLAAGGG